MELKYFASFVKMTDVVRSNRTFMELKYGLFIALWLLPCVLIVPLWN